MGATVTLGKSVSQQSELEIVNIVGSGSLATELDLEVVAADLGDIAEYNPDKYPGMYLRLDDDGPLITVYRTGKYIITGPNSESKLYSLRDRFLELLSDAGILPEPSGKWFDVQNFVCSGDLEIQLNLNALAIGLGLENTEYEPEQFPGLVYRPPNADNVALLFASGRVVITGSSEFESAEQTFQQLRKDIKETLNIA